LYYMDIIYELERRRFFANIDPRLPLDDQPVAVAPALFSDGGRCWGFDTLFNWEKIIELALLGRWRQKGTAWPEDYSDDDMLPLSLRQGGYLGNDQLVEEDDAQALADALQRAIPDVSPVECEDALRAYYERCGMPYAARLDLLNFELTWPFFAAISPLTFYGGPTGIELVSNFASFCREGAFRIFLGVFRKGGFCA